MLKDCMRLSCNGMARISWLKGVANISLFKMTILWFLILLLRTSQSESKLFGDHICLTNIMVPQEVLKWELTNKTMRSYKWCMNVPPRCSVYSYKVVNETRISTINVTKSIETCCEGFREQNNICVSQCQNCENGLCMNGTCVCQKGWEGLRCDSPIVSTTTKVPPTIELTTTAIPKIITTPTMTTTSTIRTTSSSEANLSYIDHLLLTLQQKETDSYYNNTSTSTVIIPLSTTKHPILELLLLLKQNISAQTESLQNESKSTEELEGSGFVYKPTTEKNNYNILSEDAYFDTTITEQTYISSTKNVRLHKEIEMNVENVDRDYREFDSSRQSNEYNNVEKEFFISTTSTTVKPILTEPPYNEENTIIKENLLGNPDDIIGERFEKRSSAENYSQTTKFTVSEPGSKNLIYSICAASLTTFLILVVVVTLYAVRNSRKKMEKSRTKKKVATVAVYTTSIFHSPLPELPTFENPTYLTSGNPDSNWSSGKGESIEVQDFNVVFQKPIKHPKLDCKQYLYDHPPSTGSYRASSEVDTLSQYNFSQKSLPGLVLEPLYDEIPSKENDQKDDIETSNSADSKSNRVDTNNCLYMNTCGRTKF